MIRSRLSVILLSFLLVFSAGKPEVSGQTREIPKDQSTLKLVFLGDIMGHDTQIASALATGSPGYDYRPCFQYIKPYLTRAGLVIANLEVTLAGPPYTGYPRFSSPDELAGALRESGFDILLTANNHALDRGREGFVRTLGQLDSGGILHTGTFADSGYRALRYPLLVEKNGIRIALLNYTYGTNGLNIDAPSVINRIDRPEIMADLHKAASAEPDFTIVAMHWGNEYEMTENEEQRELARFLFENGADVVIGSHPHVVQPVRGSGKGSLVVYSLGNLISNQRDRFRDGGIAFELELVKSAGGTEVKDYGYLPLWVYKPRTKQGTLFTLVPAAAPPSTLTSYPMSVDDMTGMKQFLEDTRTNLEGVREISPDWMK